MGAALSAGDGVVHLAARVCGQIHRDERDRDQRDDDVQDLQRDKDADERHQDGVAGDHRLRLLGIMITLAFMLCGRTAERAGRFEIVIVAQTFFEQAFFVADALRVQDQLLFAEEIAALARNGRQVDRAVLEALDAQQLFRLRLALFFGKGFDIFDLFLCEIHLQGFFFSCHSVSSSRKIIINQYTTKERVCPSFYKMYVVV